ncbi:tape measure protein [Endozoicomonas sp. 8E]|uniref:tape measure protein n=1 Tax=Endozoicomonas sp. 8E TaxID=3035692 RepID=UPI002938CF50|nr:tape measure protein [Endozoicomonas sp. 8E]WOG29892.1 tape measure protein [Endozoicomonas sp. 8E]
MSSIKESALRLVLKAKDTLSKTVLQSATSLESLRKETQTLKQKLSDLQKQDRLLSSFQKQTAAVRDAGKSYWEAEVRVEKLAKEFQQTEKPSRSLQRSLESARKSVVSASRAYQNQRQKLAGLRSSLEQAGLSNRNLSAQQQRLQKELKETASALQKVDAKAKTSSRTFKRSGLRQLSRDGDRASGSMGRLSKRLGTLLAASVGLYTVKRAIQGLLGTGDQFERLRVQFNAVMGSVAEGERAIQWIKQFTRETPYQLEQVAEAFVRLKAFGLDPMDGSMQAIVDQASKLGGGMERLNGISLAVGQAWAKQKLQGEEILQLVERGVPVWELLEKATGKNVQELQKLSTAGKLGRDTIALLIEEIGKSSAGAAAENMSLLSGYVSNLKDSWQNFLDEVAQSGALSYAKDQLKSLSDQISIMSEDGRLSRLAQSISDAFVQMGEAIKANFTGLTFEGVVASIQSASQRIASTLASLNNTFTVTGNAVQLLFNGFTLTVKSFGLVFSEVISSVSRGMGSLLNALGATESAQKLQSFGESLKAVSAGFREAVKEDVQDINNSWQSLGEVIIQSSQSTQQAIRNESQKTTASVEQDVVKLNSVYVQSAQTAKKAFTGVADALKQINAAETRTELSDLAVKLSQAFADGTLTQEQYNEALAASREKLAELEDGAHSAADAARSLGDAVDEAGNKQTQGAERASGTLNGLVGFYNNITSELYGLSAQAEDTFLSMQGATQIDTTDTLGELGQLKATLAETKEELQALATANVGLDTTGIGHWMKDTATNAASVRAEFYEQKIALEALVQSYENGSVSAQQMASDGQNLADSLNLLDQQDLDRLNQSIEQANDSMQRLSDSTQGTLDSLQDELDRLQGRHGDIEQRRHEARKKDLELELAIAKQDGDSQAESNLQKALSLNQSIRAEKQRQYQLQQQEKVQKQREQQAQQEKSRIQTQRQPTQSRSPEKVIRLEYPGGQVDVGVKPGDERRLLEALKNAGMRSA